jgi:hypothetical protein
LLQELKEVIELMKKEITPESPNWRILVNRGFSILWKLSIKLLVRIFNPKTENPSG